MSESYQEKKCLVCGKEIIVHDPADYVFRRTISGTDRFFCCWSHLRQWEAGRGTKISRREKIIKALQDGLSVNEIATMLDIDKTTIVYWKKKLDREAKEGR